ncbi:MAG: hypothetical protein ABR985_00190 [Methanotrichaceae archaeon]|jgi:lipopolysaccharide transport system ATP-binding protein
MRRDENYTIGHPAEEPYGPPIRFVSAYAAPGNEILDLGGEEERPVLFVSHNMLAITRLCHRTILLDEGNVVHDDPYPQVVATCLRSGVGTTPAREWPDLSKAPENDIVRLVGIRVRTEEGAIADAVDIRRPVGIEIEFEVMKPGHVLVPNFHFFNEEGTNVFIANDRDPDWQRNPRPRGRYASTAWVPGNLLAEGKIIVGSAISTMDPFQEHFYERDAVAFEVVYSLDSDSARGDYAGHYPGVVRPLLRWTSRFNSNSESNSFTSVMERT